MTMRSMPSAYMAWAARPWCDADRRILPPTRIKLAGARGWLTDGNAGQMLIQLL